MLWGGMKLGFKTYAPQVAIGVAKALLISSAITVGMSALMPVFPAAIPVIAAAMPYISVYFMAQFAVSMIDDFRFLIKNFVPVFFGKSPPDATVRQYGIRISKVGLTIAAMVATQAGMKAILRTGILQRIGINIGKGIKRVWEDEGGYVRLGGNTDKPIYRRGSGTNTNLTPRPQDVDGLSFSTEKPTSGKYVKTTIDEVNNTRVLQAIQDGPTHVSVKPVDSSKMLEWISTRQTAEQMPHIFTKLLKSIVE